MEPQSVSIERQVTRKTKVILQGIPDALQNPLFAINWFNTRIAWIYHFYNLLAAQRVFRIGGRVFFKGRVTETLVGHESMARQHLLIVNYPSAVRFLDLAADRVFQLVSILRMLTVKDFSFVLHRRVVGEQLLVEHQSWSKHNSYIVLHFRTDELLMQEVSKLQEIIAGQPVNILFASQQAVTVSIQTGTQDAVEMPYVTENSMIIEASSAEFLRQLITSNEVLQWSSSLDRLYAAIVDRTL